MNTELTDPERYLSAVERALLRTLADLLPERLDAPEPDPRITRAEFQHNAGPRPARVNWQPSTQPNR